MNEAEFPAELRPAATALRELATQATPGPWTTTGDIQGSTDVRGPNNELVAANADGPDWPVVDLGNARWIVATSPAAARPLAMWLEDIAQQLDDDEPVSGPSLAAAVLLARQINQAVVG